MPPEMLFQVFVSYLRSIGDECDYRFGAQQYLADGFGRDPAFRGLVAEDASVLIGYPLLGDRKERGRRELLRFVPELDSRGIRL
jgi:hypothetical protein